MSDNEEEKGLPNEEIPADGSAQNLLPEEEVYPSYLVSDKLTLKDFQKHLSGPLISLVLHIVIIIIACTVIVSDPIAPEEEEIEVKMTEQDMTPPPEEQKPPEPPDEQFAQTEIPNPTDQVIEQPVLNTPTVMPTISTTVTSDASTGSSSVADAAPTAVNLTAPVSNSALKLTGLYAARGAGNREVAIKKYGGSNLTEKAVQRALRWLAKNQNEDGTWGDQDPAFDFHRVQLTCLALLAFLAHGDTPQSEVYGEAIMKGLKVVTNWAENPGKCPYLKYSGWTTNNLYELARMGIVLAEGYAITGIPQLERGMNRVIDMLVKRMNPIGGFYSYFDYKKKETIHMSDLDLNSRVYNALYSAYAAGCEVPGLKSAIERAITSIGQVHKTADGGFSRAMSYGKKGTKGIFEDTAGGTLYMYLMGGSSPAAAEGLAWLENYKPGDKQGSELKMDWKNLPGTMSILGWYYMTQALFQGYEGEGSKWKKWNGSMVKSLLREQHMDGYWPCPADKYPVYIEKPDPENPKKMIKEERVMPESSYGGFSEINGRLWATVYFCMSLEVYYRYLPTFKVKDQPQKPASEGGGFEEEEEIEDDDLSL